MNLLSPEIWALESLPPALVSLLCEVTGIRRYRGFKNWEGTFEHLWSDVFTSDFSYKVSFLPEGQELSKVNHPRWVFSIEKSPTNPDYFMDYGMFISFEQKKGLFSIREYYVEEGRIESLWMVELLFMVGIPFTEIDKHLSLSAHEKIELEIKRNELLRKFGLGTPSN